MRTWAIPIIALLILLSVPVHIGAEDTIQTHGLVIDELWLDIIQSDDRESLQIIEYSFFNNSGNDIFNGSVYFWVPKGASIVSQCCGNTPNMGCRMDEGGTMFCFDVLAQDENVRYGLPFESSVFMSYFGQSASIEVKGTGENSTNEDTLFLNVTVGQKQVLGDYPIVTSDGLHITSNAEQLGVVAALPADASGMPLRLGLIQSVNITNISPLNDTVNLEISGLLEGWTAVFLEDGEPVESIVVPSNESRVIMLHMQIPTYKIETQISYTLAVGGADDPEADYLYSKHLLYDNGYIEVYAFLLRDDDVVSDDLIMIQGIWSEPDKRMWFTFHGNDRNAGQVLDFTISWKNPADYSGIVLAAFLLAILGLAGFMMYKKRRPREEKAVQAKVETVPEPVPEMATATVAELEEKKRTLLLAIKRLNADHKAGSVPKDVYDELSARYKESAIEVMKEIDRKSS